MRKYCCTRRWFFEYLIEIAAMFISVWEVATLRLSTVSDDWLEVVHRLLAKHRKKCNTTCYPKPKLKLVVNNKRSNVPIA